MAPLLKLAGAALAACSSIVSADQFIAANDTDFVDWVGRPYPGSGSGSVAFQWLATGARLSHTGSELRALVSNVSKSFKLTFSQGVENYFPWQGVTWVGAYDALPGREGILVASGPGDARVQLNMPPQYFAQGSGPEPSILGFHTDGTFTPVAPPSSPRRVLHFLGDSITAATNVHGGINPKGCADGGYQADWSSSYSGIICNALDADCTVVAVGGKGLVRNCCDNGLLMPDYYQRLRMTDAEPTFTFNGPVPAGIVVYLGTNDYDKGPSPALDALFESAFLAFMTNVTQSWYGTPSNPANITFFAVLGPMSPTAPANALTTAVAKGQAAGFAVTLVNVTTACGPDLAGCTDGCASHPGVASHRNMATGLLPVIEATLGWGPV